MGKPEKIQRLTKELHVTAQKVLEAEDIRNDATSLCDKVEQLLLNGTIKAEETEVLKPLVEELRSVLADRLADLDELKLKFKDLKEASLKEEAARLQAEEEARLWREREMAAATKIQALQRGKAGRKYVEQRKAEQAQEAQHQLDEQKKKALVFTSAEELIHQIDKELTKELARVGVDGFHKLMDGELRTHLESLRSAVAAETDPEEIKRMTDELQTVLKNVRTQAEREETAAIKIQAVARRREAEKEVAKLKAEQEEM